mmetsp:Transcript_23770/g.72120  ORF Transcript_23770/g.72120 Transcript_23770/m.72120 type:complete len:82 (-) Transcript_23770:502-747(-)
MTEQTRLTSAAAGARRQAEGLPEARRSGSRLFWVESANIESLRRERLALRPDAAPALSLSERLGRDALAMANHHTPLSRAR